MSALSSIESIGLAVKAGRKRYNLTQQQLGDLVGLSDKTIRDIEKGTGSPSLKSVVATLEALGVAIRVDS